MARSPKRDEPLTLDLFSGCGGMSLGAHLGGFRSLLAIDKDPILASAFELNFPKTHVANWDISRTSGERIRTVIDGARIDAIIGGPPCQGFSVIGKRDANDRRNHLVRHFFRLVCEMRPRIFVMENVPGILVGNAIKSLESGLNLLPKNFQVLKPLKVNAKDLGVPTDRSRVLIIGYNKDECERIDDADLVSSTAIQPVTVKDAISDLPFPSQQTIRDEFEWRAYPKKGDAPSSYAVALRSLPPADLGWPTAIEMLKTGKCSGFLRTDHSSKIIGRFANTAPGATEEVSRYPRLDWSGVSPTLRSGTGVERGSYQSARPIHPSSSRVITVREAARLQGFPDWFVFHPTKWHSFRMIGNSVSPLCVEPLFEKLRAKLA